MNTSDWIEFDNSFTIEKNFTRGYLHLSNSGRNINLIGEFRISENGKLSFRKNSCFYYFVNAAKRVFHANFLGSIENTLYQLCFDFTKARKIKISKEKYKEIIFSILDEAAMTFIEKFKYEDHARFDIYILNRPAEKSLIEDLDNCYVIIRESNVLQFDEWWLRSIVIDTGYDGIMLNNFKESNIYEEVEVRKSITLEEVQHWLEFYKNQCKERIKLLLQQIP